MTKTGALLGTSTTSGPISASLMAAIVASTWSEYEDVQKMVFPTLPLTFQMLDCEVTSTNVFQNESCNFLKI